VLRFLLCAANSRVSSRRFTGFTAAIGASEPVLVARKPTLFANIPGVGLFVVVEGPGCSIAERGWLSFPVEISEKENRLRRDIIDDKRARDHPLLVVSLGKRGEVVVKISPCSVADRDELLEAITQTVDRRPWPVSR
jgi:hypothetical protein